MQLGLYKSLWGFRGNLDKLLKNLRGEGFDGIEAQASLISAHGGAELLQRHGVDWIAEICTAGSYVPHRKATVADHLADLQDKLLQSRPLAPRFVTCIGGCDAWKLTDSVAFFRDAMQMAADAGVNISFETHRSRSLFNPWVTLDVLEALPDIRLTCDFSHWCVVLERSLDTEAEAMQRIALNAFHVHARVGYDQGPQVPHPAALEYAPWLHAHERWWQNIWQLHKAAGRALTTMTPEFGPDGYLHQVPFTCEPVADLDEINCWMAQRQREHFIEWTARSAATQQSVPPIPLAAGAG